MSLDLLSVLQEREHYFRFKRFIKGEILPKEIQTIVKDIEQYFNDHEAEECIDWNQFKDWFCLVKHPTYKTEQLQNYERIFKALEVHAQTSLAESIVERYVEQDFAARIADIALRAAEGEDLDDGAIQDLLNELGKELDRVSKLDTYIVSSDIIELASLACTDGYDWRMKFLNMSIGRLRRGKLICFAARPNVGKTTWLASEATNIAGQLPENEVVLWFNNEEDGRDVKRRITEAALQKDWKTEIEPNPVKALAEYEKVVGHKDKIILIDKADLSTKDIEEYCNKYDVGLIVIDQLWKVHGYEKSSATDTARLGRIYQWGREIAKKYAPVITVHQVKTEGEGVEWLTPSMLYMSGTVIQGEVDGLILMGRNYNPGQEQNRYISIGKVKGAYGPDVNPAFREGKTTVTIVPEKARFDEEED